MVFIKKNNVYMSRPDGSRQVRITRDGSRGFPYFSPSIADNGTIVALKSIFLHSFRPNGRRIVRPRQWAIDPSPALSTEPFNVDLSPNGRIVATQNAVYSTFYDPRRSQDRPDRSRPVHRLLRLPAESTEGGRADGRLLRLQHPRLDRLQARSQHELRDLQRSGLHEPGRQEDEGRRVLPRPGPRPGDRHQLVRPRRRRDDARSRQVRGRAPTASGDQLRRRQRRHHPDLPHGQSPEHLHAASARSAPVAGSARRPTRRGPPTGRPSSGGRTAGASTQRP